MGGVQKCRPRMSPITSLIAHNYSKQEKLGPVEMKNLDYLRKLIVKEYFRFFVWFGLLDKYEGSDLPEGVNVQTAIEYNYKLGSLFYQLYYGEK